ncbi:MAG: hypothetical protein HY864_18840 [Chloroflexi bacterium]|nr:hypothetical protein [Chloroflexota bacterium]
MKKIISLSILVIFLLSACAPGMSVSTSNLQAWVDQPVAGSILPMGAFPFKAHARHISGSGVTKIEFLVNGVSIGSADTDSSAPIVYAETSWNPAAPGRYTLASRAYAGGESSESDSVTVCVSDQIQTATVSQSGGSCDDPLAGAFPPEEVPTVAPGTAPFVEMKAEASPSYIFYGVCPAGSPTTVSFNVYIADPGAAETIRVGYSLIDSGGTVAATGGVETPSAGIGGPNNYSLSLDMNTATAGLSALITAVEFTPEGIDVLGNIVTAAPAYRISVEKCSSSGTSSGSGTAVPPTVAPPTPLPPTPAPVADTTPPAVDITLVNPADTIYYGSGCSGGILTVEAYVADNAAVGNVYLVYGYVGVGSEGIFVEMTPVGGNIYSATVNINDQAYSFLQGANGQVAIAVIGNDLAGNSAQDTGSNLNLLFCPG